MIQVTTFFRKRVWTRQQLLRLFWLALALALLWLTLRAVPLGEVWQRLADMAPDEILLLAAVNVVVLLTFSLRWWLLLYALGYVLPYLSLVGYRLATFAVSYFTPGPHFGGEPLQVYLVTARHNVPVSASLTAVVLDKILEMLANFIFLAVGVFVVLRQQTWLGVDQTQLMVSALLLVAAPTALLVGLALGWRPLTGLLRWVDHGWLWANRAAGRQAHSLMQAKLYATLAESEQQSTLLCRKHPLILLAAVGASALSWVALLFEFWLMTAVLHLELSASQAITALVAARLAILLPLPGALGALEASQAMVMRGLGLSAASGVSLSLLIRIRDVLLGILGLALAAALLGRRQRTPRPAESPAD